MNKNTKIITIFSSCVLILIGIVTTPKIAAADEVTVSENTASSATIVKENRNTSESTFNNLATSYITAKKTANYVDSTDSFISGNISGVASVQSIQTYNINCLCQKGHTKPTSPSSPTPTQPTNNGAPVSSSSSTSSTSSGNFFLSSGPGSILVASANNFFISGSYWFFIALIGNILMMLLGGYLRLRSGRSPGFAFAL